MYKIVTILIIVTIIGSYILPASLIEKIPQGPNVQRFTKGAVSWSLTTLNGVSNGWFTDTFESLKKKGQNELDEAKEDIKDSVKDTIGDKIDEGIEGILP